MKHNLTYLEQRRALKLAGPKPDSQKKIEDKERAAFFETMIRLAPAKCMESGEPLAGTKAINPAAIVAHILPKRAFRSVQNERDNIVYLSGSVHTDFDNLGRDYIVKMKIYKLLCKRVAMLLPKLSAAELKRVPAYY